MSHDPHLDKPVLELIPENLKSITDLGCGWGLWGMMLRIQKEYKGWLVGIDIHKPFVDNLKEYNVYNWVGCYDVMDYINSSWIRKLSDLFLCCELVEHLKRKDGLYLINELKKAKRVIITTPLIYSKNLKENKDNWTGNDKMFHLSGYTPEDFKGYDVRMVDITYIPRQLKPLLKIREKITGKSYSDKNIIATKGI